MGLELNAIPEKKIYPWLEEFYKSAGYSLFLAYQNNETSLRQGYILLDNSVEQLLISYKKHKSDDNKSDYYNFNVLIKDIEKMVDGDSDTFKNILEFHNTRNILYHKSVLLSVTKDRFKQYLDEICKICLMMGFENNFEVITKKFNSIFANTLDIHRSEMGKYKSEFEDLIKDTFGIIPGQYQGDFILCSPPGYTYPALENIHIILGGLLSQDKHEKTRILEVIDSNVEEPFHHFFISHTNSSVWFSFVHCFWSKKWGDNLGNDIKEIRNLIESAKSHIIYKKEYFPSERILRAFAPSLINGNVHYL